MDNDDESNERVACPNDLCTGALDHEGRCGTCDMVFAQYARAEQHEKREDEPNEARREEEPEDEPKETERESVPAAYRAPSAPVERDSSDERQCCDDDLCTGALGPDGVCGTCGRSSIKAPENAV